MHRFPAYLILLCILLRSAEMQAHAVHVQDVVLPPQGDKGFNDPKPQGEFDVLAIPLKRVQNLYMVEARVDSLVGYFILDTGAPHLVLNRTYFNTGKAAPGATQYGINGGANTVLNTVVDTLSVGELFYTLVDADIVNLGHLENAPASGYSDCLVHHCSAPWKWNWTCCTTSCISTDWMIRGTDWRRPTAPSRIWRYRWK